eukprot:3704745-Prymnesium_polylepis.1
MRLPLAPRTRSEWQGQRRCTQKTLAPPRSTPTSASRGQRGASGSRFRLARDCEEHGSAADLSRTSNAPS